MSALLVADSVTKGYGGPPVLRGLDLELVAGEGLALLGPNGAGKSTLLRLLAGLHRPERGRILLGGRPFDPRDSAQRRRIGFVSHQSLSYDGLSARENLILIARLYGLASPAGIVETALVDVGLDWVGERPVRTFSRGMSQRLSLARAFLHRPALLLLDEPMTGLDPAGCRALESLLGRLRGEGTTILMASHDLILIDPIVTAVGLLRRGRIELVSGVDPGDAARIEGLYRDTFDREGRG
ncbi:MAG: ABC transporter ATP-binding protein [Candidatus Eisenbacteria bacterium]|uniref:ABC transporter ATP-binding protein n=1 Tax=Eiseniibacteriota bacterium TaxID=2212470 RepID=A0A956LZ51_UNCEI|nr:ABC transporter ATP-binding protein [Candidatus Eisenbacteria bacterium]